MGSTSRPDDSFFLPHSPNENPARIPKGRGLGNPRGWILGEKGGLRRKNTWARQRFRPEFASSFVASDIGGLDVIEGKVAVFLIAEFGHPFEEICIMWGLSALHTDEAHAQHLWLLRCERPRRRAVAGQ